MVHVPRPETLGRDPIPVTRAGAGGLLSLGQGLGLYAFAVILQSDYRVLLTSSKTNFDLCEQYITHSPCEKEFKHFR